MPEDYNVADEFARDLQEMDLREEGKKELELARWQLDAEPELEQLIHDLRSEYYNVGTGQWEKVKLLDGSNMPSLMNDLGIQTLLMSVRFLNRNVFLSNFSDEEIYKNTMIINVEFINFLCMNARRFGIEKPNLTIIEERIIMPVFSGMKRAQLAGERRSLYESQKTITSIIQHPDAKKKTGLFGGLFGGGK